MSIQVAEYGWGYVLKCFQLMQGEGVFYLFFAVMLGYMFLIRKKEPWCKWILLYFAGLTITVYNPLIVTPLADKLHMEDEYYRLIWLLPFTVGIAWLAVAMIEKGKKRWTKMLLFVAASLLLAFPGKSILYRGITLADNTYKVPEDLIEICSWLHEDSEEKEPFVYLDFELAVLINQYDPSIQPALYYSDFLYIPSLYEEGVGYFDVTPNIQVRMDLYDVLVLQKQMDPMEFYKTLEYAGLNYLVIQKTYPNLDYLLTEHLEIVMETAQYWILKRVA